MLRRLAIVSLVLISEICQSEDRAVVTDIYPASTHDGKPRAKFCPGEVVEVARTNNDSSLIKSVNRGTPSEWVPSKILARQASFSPIQSWNGEKRPDTVAGDYSVEYSLLADGTFHRQHWDYEKDRLSPIVKGRLLRSKDILWAKLAESKKVRPEDIFVVKSDLSLCWGPDANVSTDICNCH
jgi:hypothetical protein